MKCADRCGNKGEGDERELDKVLRLAVVTEINRVGRCQIVSSFFLQLRKEVKICFWEPLYKCSIFFPKWDNIKLPQKMTNRSRSIFYLMKMF